MPFRKNFSRPIEVLDYRHLMSTILFIYENSVSKRSDIYANVSRNSNMPDRINFLVDIGILTETASVRGLVLSLTESGMEVARHLKEIESHLESAL